MLPPLPTSPQAAPKASPRARFADRDGAPAGRRPEGRRRLERLDHDPGPEGRVRADVVEHGALLSGRVGPRRDAEAHLGAHRRGQGVGGALDARRVDADHGRRRLRPEVTRRRPGADRGDPVQKAGVLLQVLDRVGRAEPVVAGQPGDGHVASLVHEAVQQPDHRHHRVGQRAAELAGMQAVVERADGDGEGDVAAQRRRQHRLAGAQVAHVGDHDDVGGEEVGVSADVVVEVADRLFLALDDELDADGEVPGGETQRRRVHHDAGLVVGRAAAVETAAAARRAPTGRSSSPAPAAPAARRSARTAARSAHPRAPAPLRTRAGSPR